MSDIEFQILVRGPQYPLIIVSAEQLYAATNLKQLAEACVASIPVDDERYVVAIDGAGEEFWYTREHQMLAPGFIFKKWTKKEIIETYNSSVNCETEDQKYPLKSLSSKRVTRIIEDICKLILK